MPDQPSTTASKIQYIHELIGIDVMFSQKGKKVDGNHFPGIEIDRFPPMADNQKY
jgi:hypothetical protein